MSAELYGADVSVRKKGETIAVLMRDESDLMECFSVVPQAASASRKRETKLHGFVS